MARIRCIHESAAISQDDLPDFDRRPSRGGDRAPAERPSP